MKKTIITLSLLITAGSLQAAQQEEPTSPVREFVQKACQEIKVSGDCILRELYEKTAAEMPEGSDPELIKKWTFMKYKDHGFEIVAHWAAQSETSTIQELCSGFFNSDALKNVNVEAALSQHLTAREKINLTKTLKESGNAFFAKNKPVSETTQKAPTPHPTVPPLSPEAIFDYTQLKVTAGTAIVAGLTVYGCYRYLRK